MPEDPNDYKDKIFSSHEEPCDKCKTTIICRQTADGSIITTREGKGFNLWGPFGLCNECSDRQDEELRSLNAKETGSTNSPDWDEDIPF
jgi:hypothetical protein